mgnify:CR=1 FL=1
MNHILKSVAAMREHATALAEERKQSLIAKELASDPMANYRSATDISARQYHRVAKVLKQIWEGCTEVWGPNPRALFTQVDAEIKRLAERCADIDAGVAEGDSAELDAEVDQIIEIISALQDERQQLDKDLVNTFFEVRRSKVSALNRAVADCNIDKGRTLKDKKNSAIRAVEDHLKLLEGVETTQSTVPAKNGFPAKTYTNVDYYSLTEAHWVTILSTLKEAVLQEEQSAKSDMDSRVCSYNEEVAEKPHSVEVKVAEYIGKGMSESVARAVVTAATVRSAQLDRKGELESEPTEFEGFDNVEEASTLADHVEKAKRRKAGKVALARGIKLGRSAEGFTTDMLNKETLTALNELARDMEEAGYKVGSVAKRKRNKGLVVEEIQRAFAGGNL